ncbi:MAG: SPOR domain-containing protein [Kiloniellales bacterium]|nr:SPOR domain-containing protein [Kiloniellales bacterium]
MAETALLRYFLICGLCIVVAYAAVTKDFTLSTPRYKIMAYAEIFGDLATDALGNLRPEVAEPSVAAKPDADAPAEKASSVAISRTSPEAFDPSQNHSHNMRTGADPDSLNGQRQAKRFFVQLSSLRSSEDAEDEWSRLAQRHKDLIGLLDHSVLRVELPAKGIFYRLMVGPLPRQTEASQLCDNLRAGGQDCLVLDAPPSGS